MNISGSIDGFGTQRLFGLYVGSNQNLSKLSQLIESLSRISFRDQKAKSNRMKQVQDWFSLIVSTHSPPSSLPSLMIPLIGVSIAERCRDRGFDRCIRSDDLSKHSRSYRQTSPLQNKIPSRDAYPSDVSNIHSTPPERVAYGVWMGTLRNGRSSISCLPIIETINADISEYIATNVIPITDRQFYMNKTPYYLSSRPAIDSSPSATRIGSNAQCKRIKLVSAGIKNDFILG